MTDSLADGLLWAWRLDGAGGATPLDAAALRDGAGRDGTYDAPVWVHLQLSESAAEAYAASAALGLPPAAVEGLFAKETRPRALALDEGLLVNLRGVNLNPDSEPEDMVSVRLWLEPGRVVSVRLRGVIAVREVSDRLAAGTGPRCAAAVVAEIARGLGKKVQPVLLGLKERLDDLEEEAETEEDGRALRGALAELRAEVIALARYLRPQVQAVRDLRDILEETNPPPPEIETMLAHAADRFLREVEDLDVVRDQAQVLQERLDATLAERMGRTTYMLSVVAGVFLPITFVTGLLGMNVGGIPLADTEWGFATVVAAMVAVGLFEVWLFRRLRWV